MRKMKRLFKARERFIPWWHWSVIHFVLNALSLTALFVTCFLELTVLRIHWLIACLVQLIPIFTIWFVASIFERKLSKNALDIIMRKLEESKVTFKNIDISIKESKLYSCAITVSHGLTTVGQVNEFLTIIHDTNRKFGNVYNIINITSKYDNFVQEEK